ncbi:MAG: radical SAM protein [Pseudoflavonifractor sp.]|nr:radical SAM protein [Alloprevotella sp.]MCM1117073.1 radical SAM protein [Pseudoflavonifractor sp.]
MQTVLFHDTIFGPIHSRRLGTSLGVNLTPNDGKICTFDCLYCEAGYNAQGAGTTGFPPLEKVAHDLEETLKGMRSRGEALDVITFSGNGEPTLHPRFAEVIDATMELRDKYYPEVKISVLSNATRAMRPDVAEALRKVDNNILKLDSAMDTTMQLLDRPTMANYTPRRAIEAIAPYGKQCIVQTMLTRGEHDGQRVDNTTPEEIDALIEAYRQIEPREVMLYSIDRQTPERSLQKVGREELEAVAERIRRETGIPVQVA